jgi:hypothetical protein
MFFMRKLKNVTVMNSTEALGIIPGDHSSDEGLDRIIALWGSDPVHPTREAYKRLANRVLARATKILTEPDKIQNVTAQKKRKPDHRDQWVTGSQAVAPRLNPSQGFQQRGGFPKGSNTCGRSLRRGASSSRGGWEKNSGEAGENSRNNPEFQPNAKPNIPSRCHVFPEIFLFF